MYTVHIRVYLEEEEWRELRAVRFWSTCRGAVSPLYRIKKRKRRQTRLLPRLPPSTPRAKRVTRFAIHDGNSRGAKSARRRRKFSSASFQPPSSSPPFHRASRPSRPSVSLYDLSTRSSSFRRRASSRSFLNFIVLLCVSRRTAQEGLVRRGAAFPPKSSRSARQISQSFSRADRTNSHGFGSRARLFADPTSIDRSVSLERHGYLWKSD